jgi:hypothetical protein
MPDTALSQALKEAYASAPSDQIILHTLELRHPAFVDELGQTTAIRVVRDTAYLDVRLEASAALNGGEMVRFIAMGFELDLPPVDTLPVPEITVTLDNVSREIVRHLDAAAESQAVIEVTYRPYLSTDLEGPQMDPPIHLVLTEVEADIFRITGGARMLDVGNKSFPGISYTAKTFPGLTR